MAEGQDLAKNASTRPVAVSQPSPPARQQPGPLGAMLIWLTCLASGAVLAAGRQLIVALAPPLTAASSTAQLQRSRHWSVDPSRRRDAALLLANRSENSPAQQLRRPARQHFQARQGLGPAAHGPHQPGSGRR